MWFCEFSRRSRGNLCGLRIKQESHASASMPNMLRGSHISDARRNLVGFIRALLASRGETAMSTPRDEAKFDINDPHYLGICKQDCEICAGKSESVEPTPSPEQFWENGTFVKIDKLGLTYEEYCGVFEFAQAYADMVSKPLRDELAHVDKLYYEMEAKWVNELLTVSNEIGALRARISELERE